MIDPIAEQNAISGWQAGDRAAGADLLKMHKGIIISAVRRYVTTRCEMEDLVQVGSIAMLHSATSYKPHMGKFVSHAFHMMQWKCNSYARSVRHDLHVTRQAEEVNHFFGNPNVKLSKSAAALVRTNRVQVERAVLSAVRLDAPIGDSDETYLDRLAQPANDTMASVDVDKLLATLTKRDRAVLQRRYAEVSETLQEIGKSMSLTKERVRQIEREAIDKLRRTVGRMAA